MINMNDYEREKNPFCHSFTFLPQNFLSTQINFCRPLHFELRHLLISQRPYSFHSKKEKTNSSKNLWNLSFWFEIYLTLLPSNPFFFWSNMWYSSALPRNHEFVINHLWSIKPWWNQTLHCFLLYLPRIFATGQNFFFLNSKKRRAATQAANVDEGSIIWKEHFCNHILKN